MELTIKVENDLERFVIYLSMVRMRKEATADLQVVQMYPVTQGWFGNEAMLQSRIAACNSIIEKLHMSPAERPL